MNFNLDSFEHCPSKPSTQSVDFFRKKTPALIGLNIGTNNDGYNLRIGAPHLLDETQVFELKNTGEVLIEALETTNSIYQRALKGGFDDKTKKFIIVICEGGASKPDLDFQRDLFAQENDVDLPMFFRADMLDLETAVELNAPGGGQALVQGVQKLVNSRFRIGKGLAKAWAEGIKNATNSNQPRIAINSIMNGTNGAKYFSDSLRSEGVNVTDFKYGYQLPEPSEIDLAINMGAFEGEKWDRYVTAYRDKDLLFDNPPVTTYHSKVPEILAFHPLTSQFYSDSVRSKFPATYLVEEGRCVQLPSGETIEVEDLWSASQRNREFVLKYAGADRSRSSGGSHVFQLDGPKERSRTFINHALDDWEENSQPWLLQPRLKSKHRVYPYENNTFSEANMRARFMPYYVNVRKKVELATASVLFSSNWKVHGNTDSVHCPLICENQN